MKTLPALALAAACLYLTACQKTESPTEPSHPPAQESPAIERGAAADTGEMEPADGIELEGYFRYLADAALFRDCRTNLVFPVAMESAYRELERMYLDSGIEGGEEIYAALTGRYLEREAMEGNTNEVKLIVDNVKEVSLDKSCTPQTHASLRDTYWKLIELNGSAVQLVEGQREPHIILATAESGISGNAGCNRLLGSYQADDEKLSFSPLGMTRMACEHGMEIEQAFTRVLGETNRYEIDGLILSLLADDQVLARLEAVALP